MTDLVGIDGCGDGWVCVVERGESLRVLVVSALAALLDQVADDALVAIDVPIGLTDAGPRSCDVEARRLLRAPRASSVFPAPVRASLAAATYLEACDAHQQADGRRMSRQAFAILPKIREVDLLLSRNLLLQGRVREVHPEVSFALWNGGRPMLHRKSRSAGHAEREALIDSCWPGERVRLLREVAAYRCKADDLNDAFAALWSVRRARDGQAVTLPASPAADALGLHMEMIA